MIILAHEWKALRCKKEIHEKEMKELKFKQGELTRSLGIKGYQTSAKKHKYYAILDGGMVPFNTPEEATAARRFQTDKKLAIVALRIEKLEAEMAEHERLQNAG